MLQDGFDSGDEAFRGVLGRLMSAEHREADGKDAARLRQGFREEINYGFVLKNPLARVTEQLQVYPAVARFIWMMAANNRLADIAFHEPKVKAFTDDNLTVPGSSYGMRLRQSQPGLDQVQGAIHRLKSENDSRRAAVTIFQPIDAVRESKDIPCAFGLFFHNRDNALSSTVLMRSNNAFRLLPFNIFEFSLLAEVVAVESQLAAGPLSYFAGSMHLYDNDHESCSAFLKQSIKSSGAMGAMPNDVSPLEQIGRICQFENELRQSSSIISSRNIGEWLEKAGVGLNPYWAQLSLVLLSGVAASIDKDVFNIVAQRIEFPLRAFLPQPVTKLRQPQAIGPLFDEREPATKVVPIWRAETARKFELLASEHEVTTGKALGARQLLRAQAIVLDRLAARGEASSLTTEAFLKALEEAS